MNRLPLIVSFFLFIALCVSLTYWGMQLFKPSTKPVAPPPVTVQQEVRIEPALTLFGGQANTAVAASNYELKGVVMSGSAGESIAIVSADGKPAQAIPVNKELMPGVVVKEVHPRYVVLLENGIAKRVELPEGAKGQEGMLTPQSAMSPQEPSVVNTQMAPPPNQPTEADLASRQIFQPGQPLPMGNAQTAPNEVQDGGPPTTYSAGSAPPTFGASPGAQ
jgi:general secretion pathway protein C